MKCFNHPSVDAVGLCRSCSRALCHDCLTEVGGSICCKGRCEADVEVINRMIQWKRSAVIPTGGSWLKTAIFCVIFLVLGLTCAMLENGAWLLVVMAVMLAAYGLFSLPAAWRVRGR